MLCHEGIQEYISQYCNSRVTKKQWKSCRCYYIDRKQFMIRKESMTLTGWLFNIFYVSSFVQMICYLLKNVCNSFLCDMTSVLVIV